jgi:hypothetical protein
MALRICCSEPVLFWSIDERIFRITESGIMQQNSARNATYAQHSQALFGQFGGWAVGGLLLAVEFPRPIGFATVFTPHRSLLDSGIETLSR